MFFEDILTDYNLSSLHVYNSCMSRVPDQNGVSQAWYIVQIHPSGWKPMMCILEHVVKIRPRSLTDVVESSLGQITGLLLQLNRPGFECRQSARLCRHLRIARRVAVGPYMWRCTASHICLACHRFMNAVVGSEVSGLDSVTFFSGTDVIARGGHAAWVAGDL